MLRHCAGLLLAPRALHKCNQDRLDTVEVHAAVVHCIQWGALRGTGREGVGVWEAVHNQDRLVSLT